MKVEELMNALSNYPECMLCGNSHIRKVRMPMPKPEFAADRWHYQQQWCGCES